jgi:hypothetical protein
LNPVVAFSSSLRLSFFAIADQAQSAAEGGRRPAR